MFRSSNEMMRAAAVVHFEYHQFHWAITQFPKEWRCGTGGFSRGHDAIVEVVLLHARVLFDFFSVKKPRYETDIIAPHFFDAPDGWIRPATDYLDKQKVRLDQSLAHLSYARLGAEGRCRELWDFGKTRSEISGAWEKFLGALPDNRRQWFGDDEHGLWLP